MSAPSLEELAREYCEKRRFSFRRKVGEGTFKETFEVVDCAGVSTALKLHKPGALTKRSSREIEAMIKCDHPNVAKLIATDQFRINSLDIFVVLEEYLPGGTLTRRGQLSPDDVFALGVQLIAALGHIASIGLVHRDIKPDNIMFRADGTTPVVVDFGTVRVLGDSSLTPTWVPRGPGSPFYSSPEQLNNQKDLTDWRSDQFSLGVVLAEASTGEHPYQAGRSSAQRAVEAAAQREPLAQKFAECVRRMGLPALPQMVAPWPVQRYRTPSLLSQAWAAQRR